MSSSCMTPRLLPIESSLLGAVDGMRPFVIDRMRGRLDDVDSVLQRIRETVWRRAAAYDPSRGRPEDYVFGISRNIVRRELARHPVRNDVLSESVVAKTRDPLSVLTARFDSRRWMRLVAEYAGEDDWKLVVELALDEDAAGSVSSRLGISQRTLRSVRERVALIAATVRAAVDASDAGCAASTAAAIDCLPEAGGVRSVLPFMGANSEEVAQLLGVHPGTARARLATAKRLLQIAMSVLESEAA